MRILAVILLSLISLTCFAALPEYSSSQRWIEQHAPKSQTPPDERMFIGDSIATTNTFIVHFQAGFSLRDAIDLTRYKGSEAFVIVLRSEHKTQPVFFDTVKQSEKPKFELRAKDVIWISPRADIN